MTEATVDKVLRLAREGKTYAKISTLTGVPVRRAGEIARRAGIHRRPGKAPAWWEFTPEQQQRACEMYIDGDSVESICADVVVSDSTLRQWLGRMGVKRRKSGRKAVYDPVRIRALRLEFSTSQVASIVGCSSSTVSHHCKVA